MRLSRLNKPITTSILPLLLFPLPLISCCPCPCGPPNLTAPLNTKDYEQIGPLAVFYPSSMRLLQREQVAEALSLHLAAWEADFKTPSKPLVVHVTMTDTVPCGRLRDRQGCATTSFIQVIAGDYNEVPFFYHELVHANEASSCGLDPDHEDVRWKGVWEDRQQEVCRRMRKFRRVWKYEPAQ